MRNYSAPTDPQPAVLEERRKGTYILILHLVMPAVLTVGKLGTFDFSAGWYAYVGSAFGAGGLRGRLRHHLSPVKKPHWHIDYLRQETHIPEIWYTTDATTHEHEWAGDLCAMTGAVIPVPRFGSSDCTCETHLIYFSLKLECAAFCASVPMSVRRWSQ